MTREQALKLIKILTAAFPQRNIEEDTIRVYTISLLDLDYHAAEKAVMDEIATCTFFPSIAEIRRAVAEAELKMPSAEEAWIEAREAARRYSPYDKSPVEFSCPAVRKAAEAIGWHTLLYDENRVAVAAQFRKTYEAIREREILDRQKQIALPEAEGKVRALHGEVRRG